MVNDHLVWRKATACANGACLEVAFTEDLVLVRDRVGQRLAVSREAWKGFLAAIKTDDFEQEPERS
jgi:hypothetical protein